MKKAPVSFSIEIFEQSKLSDTLSKARAGIFYKGVNRNGGYIDDAFAEKLIETLPYTPVKGIYDEDEQDFTDHGKSRDLGRIYGIIPSKDELNLSWEEKTDTDGVVRSYVVVDAYLFTTLYEEAKDIVGKPLSMELHPPSLKGDWINMDEGIYFKYSEGHFLGVQVLGDGVEPCFEGASFFSLESQKWFTMFMELSSKVDDLITGRQEEMKKKYIFELSSNQTDDAIFQAVNTEEKVRYYVRDRYKDYAILYCYDTSKYFKVNYTIDENDKVIVGTEFVELFAEYLTKGEVDALKELRGTNTTYAEALGSYQASEKRVKELESQVNENLEKFSTLEVEKENFEQQVKDLTEERDALNSYKVESEEAEKKEILEKYSVRLTEEVTSAFEVKLSEYTAEDLKKDLAYELVQQNEDLFSLNPQPALPKPSGDEGASGLESLLNKYK